MNPTKACRCCDGSGTELDNVAVGAVMQTLRKEAGISLRALGKKMKPPLRSTYLCDLEHGARRWNDKLIAQYRKHCV